MDGYNKYSRSNYFKIIVFAIIIFYFTIFVKTIQEAENKGTGIACATEIIACLCCCLPIFLCHPFIEPVITESLLTDDIKRIGRGDEGAYRSHHSHAQYPRRMEHRSAKRGSKRDNKCPGEEDRETYPGERRFHKTHGEGVEP